MRALITGGTGSLGHALVSAWLQRDDLERLVVYSRDEKKQADMRALFPDPRLIFMLGDVRDIARLKLAFYSVDTVIHAAALKRVDATANDPLELYKTNVQGTANVLQAALAAGVRKTLLISSDKACLPANAYGASKFMAEQLAVNFNVYGAPRGCVSSVVRYGNVLGSRGSVVHVWRGQGDRLTLTEPGMTRFILTMEQAVGIIDSAVDAMEGGEVFVPYRLPAARMEDLAQAVCAGAEYIYGGLRPGGEKMHELLLSEEESTRTVEPGVLLPHQSTWHEKSLWANEPRIVDGERCSYNAPMLSVEDLKRLLRTVPEGGV
jgi:UDP-N-acetylglucosamine 4,6-dehydratase